MHISIVSIARGTGLGLCFASGVSVASGTGMEVQAVNLTATPYALLALLLFVLAYVVVILEEFLHLRKSKPVLVVAGII